MMTDEELISALRVCGNPKGHRCSSCPLIGYLGIASECRNKVRELAADRIEEMNKEIADRERAHIEQHSDVLFWRDTAKAFENDVINTAMNLENMAKDYARVAAENEKLKKKLKAAIIDIYSGNVSDCVTCLHGLEFNRDCDFYEETGKCEYKWRGEVDE